MEGSEKMNHAANNLDYQKYYDGDDVKATAGEHMAMLLDLLKNEIATFSNPYDIYERIDAFKDVMETIEAIAEAPKEKEYILTWADWSGFLVREA